MDVSMDPTDNNNIADVNDSGEQQDQSGEAESSIRPSLSQVKKSWGFRRTTIARREFMDEVGDLAHSPPLVRRGRSRRTCQTLQTTSETYATQRTTAATRSVIDDLEWSAPSSPVSEESKPASEAFAGGSLDPSMWQDFGSAFHTAFSLLGGNEGLSLEMSDALPVSDMAEAIEAIEPPPPQALDETELLDDNMEAADDMENSHPVDLDIVAAGDVDDVVLISGHEEDSDEMTLLQIKEQLEHKNKQRARGGKGGKGKARGKGRGRGRRKARGRGRGRGRAVELQLSIADDEDTDNDVIIVNPVEQQLQVEEKLNDSCDPAEMAKSPAHSVISLSPAQRSNPDCIYIESDLDQVTDATPGQYDDAPEEQEEEEEEKDSINEGEHSDILDSKGYDSSALYCICRQKHNNRFMICCDSCQEWFHGSCVGVSETEGRTIERRGKEYICPPCNTKKESQFQPQPEPEPQPEPQQESQLSSPECLTQSPSGEEVESHKEQQALKETEVLVEEEEEKKTPVMWPGSAPEAEMKLDNSLPLCIGPACSKQALPDSVYCGTDCILKHAAVTMKTLSVPKVLKSRGRAQRKATTDRPTVKALRSGRMSQRLAGKAEEEGEEEEMQEDCGVQKEPASPSACDPSLTEVQATSLLSSKFFSASKTDNKQVEAETEEVTPSKQSPEDSSTDGAPSSQPATDPTMPQSPPPEKPEELISSSVSKRESADSNSCVAANSEKSSLSPATQSPTTSAPRHHETGAIMVSKTTYVIPKKQSVPQPLSSHVPALASSQKPASAPTLLNETRNLLVPPAPSAPSSRPSQPNNQVRQSIQRSLTGILFKRVCDCEDLEMTESEVAKLVASIEMEMFDIFRNTDSKYMNKYRTIMFNLKDPRNKGLLYRVVRGEISPFRLVRMSQKDMQAVKASEPSAKETTEAKDAAAKLTSLLPKPEAVKVDLPSLNPARPDRSVEQKKSVLASTVKTRTSLPSQSSTLPDVLTCMLKDTTSEHKTHLFDLKCKICTGQMPPTDEEEPTKKRQKISETRDKYDPSRRKSAGDDSPLRAPPDSPDMDSPTSFLMDSSSRLTIDSPVLTIVESPASPIMDSPASPTLDSPASPVMDSPASPTPDIPKATKSKTAYAPGIIPAVSTVTITRRDPRTAASRLSAPASGSSSPSNATHTHSVPYAPLKETRLGLSPAPASSKPPTRTLPKSILMKPTPSADPRLYGTSSRTVISESTADDETTQFLAKQDILWKGFLNMLTVAKFVTKAYLVSGSAENLKADLPDTIQIGGRIMPETVWDYVAKLKTSVTKELCVIRFHPATEEEEVAYVSLFSYFSSRGRFGVVANGSRNIKDLYLVPLSAQESIPSILLPFEGPGLEKKRPNLLMGLAIVQKAKRPGSFFQEPEERRPKVQLSKDPMWIPKPPVLYGSDKLEIFQPYNPETPVNTTPPASPSCPGSPSSSSSESITIPSLLSSIRTNSPVSTSASAVAAAVAQPSSNTIPDKNPVTASSDKTPLQTILKSLFGSKQTDSMVHADGSSAKMTGSVKKLQMFSQVSGPMVDPIVQQYGQKSKVKEIEEEENDFDRPYDPEEEYDPTLGYGAVAPQSIEKIEADGMAVLCCVEDDVAYDPEDETIFADFQSDVAKLPAPTQISDSSANATPISTQAVTPTPTSTTMQNSSQGGVMQIPPTGTVVVSAATLTEQQRMLEELNKQIEEQKRQLKEQEEALRQQREAVGMFMAHFSVSDSLMSPPSKSLPLNKPSSLQGGLKETESRPSESKDKTNLTEPVDSSNVNLQTVKLEDKSTILNLKNDADTVSEQDETQANLKESDRYSSAGEIEDSDVAYDPEDESLFNEIQEDVFQGGSKKTCDSSLSRTGRSASHKGTPQNSHHSRKRKLSPKRRGHRERAHYRSPSRKSQRRSPSHSQRRRERDRHRRSERDRSRHRARDQSERQGRHRKDHTSRRHSHGSRRSPSSLRRKESLSPKRHRRPSPKLENSSTLISIKNDPDGHQLKCNLVENPDENCSGYSHKLLHSVKLEILEQPTSGELLQNSVSEQDSIARGPSIQVDKSSHQKTLVENKIEYTVPLREIDPPIRDSPQSPDPEPQFVKPCSIEKSAHVKSEKIREPETYTSVSKPLEEVEINCLPVGSQDTLSNKLKSSSGDLVSTARNLGFRVLDLQGSGASDQDMIEPDKKREGELLGLKNPDIEGRQGRHSDPPIGSDTHISGTEIDPVTKCPGPCKNGPGIKNPGPDMYLRETGNSFSVPDVRVPGMQCISQISEPGPNIQNMQGTKTNLSEAGIHDHSTDNIALGSVTKGSGIRSLEQNMKSSRMQILNPEVKCAGPDVRCSELEMSDQKLVLTVTNLHMRGSGLQNESRGQVMKSPVLDDLGTENRGLVSRETLSTTSQNTRRQMVIGEKRSQDVSLLQKGFLCLKTGEHRSQTENPCGRPGVMQIRRDQSFGGPQMEDRAPDIGGIRGQNDSMNSAMSSEGIRDPTPDSFVVGSGRIQRQPRQDGSPVLEERGHQKIDFPRYIKDADMSMRDFGKERNFNSNMSAGSDSTSLRVDRLFPAVTDDRCGPQGRKALPVTGPGSNTNFQSSGDRKHFMESQPDIRAERSLHGLEMRGSDSMHELRRPDIKERSYMGHGQDIDSMGGPGPGNFESGIRGQRSQNKGMGPCMSDPVWNGPGSDIQDDWRGPDRRGSDPGMGGLCIQDEWRVHHPDSRSPNIEDLRHGRRGPEFMTSGPERRGPDMKDTLHERRGPGERGFMGPGPERRGSDMEVPVHGRRGPGGPDFRRPEPERRGPTNDDQGPGMGGPGGPDFERRTMESPGANDRGPGPNFRRPLPDWRAPQMEASGSEWEGPLLPDFGESHPEGRGLSIKHPAPAERGPDFRGPGPYRRDLFMEVPGPDRRGLGDTDFGGPGPEGRGPVMEELGSDGRGSGHPDFSGPGPDWSVTLMGGSEPDRRGAEGPNYRESVPDRRFPTMGGLGPGRIGPGGPDFREPESDRRDAAIAGLGPDRKRPGGSDFSVLEPDRRGPVMQCVESERKCFIPGVSRLGHERRDHIMDRQDPERRGPGHPDFHGQGPERRWMFPNKGGQGGPGLRGSGCWRRPSIQTQAPDRRGPGDQNNGGLGPDKDELYMSGPGSDLIGLGIEHPGPRPNTCGQEGPHFRSSEPESGYQNIDGPWPDRRGPDVRGVRPERSDSGLDGRGINRKGPGGQNMRPGLQHSGQNMEGPLPDRRGPEGPNFRGAGRERGPPEMEETDNSKGFPLGPQLRDMEPERRPLDMEHRESNRRGPHFRGVRHERMAMEVPMNDRKGLRGPDFRGPACEFRGPDIIGPEPDRQEPRGSMFREPGPEKRGPDMKSPGTDWRRLGGPIPGIRETGPNAEGQRHRRDQWEGVDPGGSELIQGSPDPIGPGSDRIGQNIRGPGHMRRNIRGPRSGMSRLNEGDRWKGPDFRGSTPGMRGTLTEEQWSDRRGPSIDAVGNKRECSSNDWKRHGDRGPRPIHEGPFEQLEEHGSQGPPMEWRGHENEGLDIQERPNMQGRGPGDDWSGSHFKGPRPVRDVPDMLCPGPSGGGSGNEWKEPERGSGRTNRIGPGQFFRGVREPDKRGQGHDRRNQGMRGPTSDMRMDDDMGNVLGKDCRQPDFRGNVTESNMEGRFSDCVGLRSERQSVNMKQPGSNRQGFENFKRERRGPEMRRLGLEKTNMRGLALKTPGIRHGPGKWDTITEGPGSDSRGYEPASPNFSSPHAVPRFQDGSHSASFSGPLGPASNSGGNPCPGFDNHKNQQAVKPKRHRGALLATPPEGPLCFPNYQINHSMNRGGRRGRPVSRQRVFIKEQRQEQEKSPAGKIRTFTDKGTVGREEKKEEGN